MARSTMFEGPPGRVIARLAAPVIAAEAIHVGFHLVDVWWVGPLGAWATGAILTSMFTLWIVFALAQLVMTGLTAHVSRAMGAGDRGRAAAIAARALWLAAGLSLVVVALGAAFADDVFDLLGADPQVAAAGTDYLRISCLGAPFAFAYNTLGAIMRACGNTRRPFVVTAVAVALNVVLAPLLVYGVGPFPEWGVAGSAVATVASMAAATFAYVELALRRHPDLPIDGAELRRPHFGLMADIARVGAPHCAIGVLFSLVYLWYSHLAAGVGTAALAIVGIANRLESVTYLSGDGFGVATATFVGHELGARRPERAERGAWTAATIMCGVGIVAGVAFVVAPAWLIGLFTPSEEAIAVGVPYVRVLGICQLSTGLEAVLGGAFAGAGDTVPPLAIHVVYAVLRIPLAAWACLGLDMGVMGIAWTMTITSVVRSATLAWWFSRGRWKLVQLPGSRPLPPSEDPDAAL